MNDLTVSISSTPSSSKYAAANSVDNASLNWFLPEKEDARLRIMGMPSTINFSGGYESNYQNIFIILYQHSAQWTPL